jgi:hypothetical protein
MVNRKFMQSLDDKSFRRLKREAKKRGCLVQELLRAVILPDWIERSKREKKILQSIKAAKID